MGPYVFRPKFGKKLFVSFLEDFFSRFILVEPFFMLHSCLTVYVLVLSVICYIDFPKCYIYRCICDMGIMLHHVVTKQC